VCGANCQYDIISALQRPRLATPGLRLRLSPDHRMDGAALHFVAWKCRFVATFLISPWMPSSTGLSEGSPQGRNQGRRACAIGARSPVSTTPKRRKRAGARLWRRHPGERFFGDFLCVQRKSPAVRGRNPALLITAKAKRRGRQRRPLTSLKQARTQWNLWHIVHRLPFLALRHEVGLADAEHEGGSARDVDGRIGADDDAHEEREREAVQDGSAEDEQRHHHE